MRLCGAVFPDWQRNPRCCKTTDKICEYRFSQDNISIPGGRGCSLSQGTSSIPWLLTPKAVQPYAPNFLSFPGDWDTATIFSKGGGNNALHPIRLS
jgi:hypothetical protein